MLNTRTGFPLEVVRTEFAKDLAARLGPFLENIEAVVCRGDKNIQYLRKIVPLLPKSVRVASEKSLRISTDKKLMREAFLKHYPEISPRYTQVFKSDKKELERIEHEVGYPLILKPANLASSLLIQACFNREQLEKSLVGILKNLENTYCRENRLEKPQLIAEQYLEGEFYSIDAYIMGPSQVYFCPPVKYFPASQLGIDDFFLYCRIAPGDLSKEETKAANDTTAKAIKSVGLTHSSAHVELVRTSDGWKVIELGPRIGRFRHRMYDLSYGIDHILNDAKIHLGISPVIKERPLQYCAAYSIYPRQEGRLSTIEGLDFLKKQPELASLKILANEGDDCRFAKNGGHAVGEFVIAAKNHQRFLKLGTYIDENVKAAIS